MNHESSSVPPSQPRRGRRWLLVILILAGGVAAAWRAGLLPVALPASTKPEARAARVVQPQPVVLTRVERRSMPVRLITIGTVQPVNTVAIRPRVEGEILRLHFIEGQTVKEGEVILTLDARPYDIQLRQAEAALARDQVQLDRARVDMARYQVLLARGNATPQKADDTRAASQALEASVKAGQAAIDAARLNLSYATIRAPISGRTGLARVKEGNLARPTDALPVVTLTQFDPITVIFTVPERELPALRRAQATGTVVPVRAKPPDDPTLPAEGALDFIDSLVDVTSGMITVRASFANPKARLWPGQFVEVTVDEATEAEALVVPAQAVQSGQAGPYVFVARTDATAETRPVAVARVMDGVAVITRGLAVDERVVIDGQLRLTPGTPIVERSPASASPGLAAPTGAGEPRR
ncbi:membrane fusion protein, multidrug efflux system [uncultured Gammaproteobacteria bacterium]